MCFCPGDGVGLTLVAPTSRRGLPRSDTSWRAAQAGSHLPVALPCVSRRAVRWPRVECLPAYDSGELKFPSARNVDGLPPVAGGVYRSSQESVGLRRRGGPESVQKSRPRTFGPLKLALSSSVSRLHHGIYQTRSVASGHGVAEQSNNLEGAATSSTTAVHLLRPVGAIDARRAEGMARRLSQGPLSRI